jgi:hypothetical protein
MLEKCYTFNDGKVGSHLVVSTHIDKFMVLIELDVKGGKLKLKHWSNDCHTTPL